ncbi:RNA polymerase sigma factor [Paenibacillus turpanensis]|uniref:RNA polymerase sigma factor n=1 Tax=Paenibacillus turpanensis TaxID=2689078 RepID=UPI00140D3951|nr:RNA polymerase sigma factor [Paenibacillus turpanensis]
MTERELFDSYKSDIYRFCYYYLRNTEDAEDACQDTFMKAFRQEWRGIANVKAWLLRIALNTCRDLGKRRTLRMMKERLFFTASLEQQAYVSSPVPGEQQESAEELRGLLQQLPEKLRVTLTLKYVQDLTNEEIAGVLRIPTGTVKSRLHAGLARLKTILQQDREGAGERGRRSACQAIDGAGLHQGAGFRGNVGTDEPRA